MHVVMLVYEGLFGLLLAMLLLQEHVCLQIKKIPKKSMKQ